MRECNRKDPQNWTICYQRQKKIIFIKMFWNLYRSFKKNGLNVFQTLKVYGSYEQRVSGCQPTFKYWAVINLVFDRCWFMVRFWQLQRVYFEVKYFRDKLKFYMYLDGYALGQIRRSRRFNSIYLRFGGFFYQMFGFRDPRSFLKTIPSFPIKYSWASL